MAKEQKSSLYNIEKEENKSKKINKKKKQKQHQNGVSSNRFSFENEIIIGVTKNNEDNVSKKKVNKSKKANKKINNNIKKKASKKNVKEKKIVLQEVDEYELEKKYEEKVRKNAKRLKIFKIFSIVLLIIAVILIIMFSPLFNIKDIVVQGNEEISSDQIISLSQIKTNENIFKLHRSKIKKEVQENKYIEDIKISLKLPSTVILDVSERKRSYLLEYANGFVVLDQKGYILQLIEERIDLPIIQGIEITGEEYAEGKRLDTKDLNKIFICSKIMETAKSNNIDELIKRIDIENEKNIKLIFETKDKTAYIGDSSNLNIKLLTIEQILGKTEGVGGEIFVDMDLNTEYPIFRERV